MPNDSDTSCNRPSFRFSLRLLLILTAIVAVATVIGVNYYRDYLGAVAHRRAIQFIEAVQSGNLAETDRLLDMDPELAHGREHRGVSTSLTPLQLAILFGRNGKVVARILEEEPALDEKSSSGKTALHLVVENGMISEVARLLGLGANANAADDDGFTSLHLAARADRTGEMTKLLLEGGADPNATQPEDDGKTPLHIAAEIGRAATASQLLKGGADVNAYDAQGKTPIYYAFARDHVEVAQVLSAYGADLTAQDHAREIPRQSGEELQAAALVWWEKIVEAHDQNKVAALDDLLDAAPDALYFRTGYTPSTMLHRAIFARRLDVLDYLLSRQMNTEVRGQHRQTPLHDACGFGHTPLEFAKHLLAAGADIEARDQAGRTPLHMASREHNHEAIELLLAEGADIDARDSGGTTVLDIAFERRFPQDGQRTLARLRAAGHPATVLYAAATGDVELLDTMTRGDLELLERAYTRNGVRPLHAAVLGQQLKVAEWLIDRGIDCDAQNPDGWSTAPEDTPLMATLSRAMPEMAILLINHGAAINLKGRTGHYPVHAVIDWNRSPAILEALLARGADPHLTYEGKTARQLAEDVETKHRQRYLELLDAADDVE